MGAQSKHWMQRGILALGICTLVGLAWWSTGDESPRPRADDPGAPRSEALSSAETREIESSSPPNAIVPQDRTSPEERPRPADTWFVRTFDPGGRPVGGIPVVFGIEPVSGPFRPRRLGTTDSSGILQVTDDSLFQDLERIRFEPDVLSPEVRPVVVAGHARHDQPIDLVVPDHGAIEIQVLGPDGRPWPSTWSLGILGAVGAHERSREPQESRCDDRGVCRFLVAADGRRHRFRFRADGRRRSGFSTVLDLVHDDPSRPTWNAPNRPGTTIHRVHRVDPTLCLVTGRIVPWEQVSDQDQRFERHSLKETGEWTFNVVRPFPDGTFALLVNRGRGRETVLIKHPQTARTTIARPTTLVVDELSRQALGVLRLSPPPRLWTGRFELGVMRQEQANFRIESSGDGEFWHGVRSASLRLLDEDRFEIVGLLPERPHYRLSWSEEGLVESMRLPLDPTAPELVWDLTDRASATVLIRGRRASEEDSSLWLLKSGGRKLLNGTRGLGPQSDLESHRFRGLESGSYAVILGSGPRIGDTTQRIEIPPGTDRRYYVSANE